MIKKLIILALVLLSGYFIWTLVINNLNYKEEVISNNQKISEQEYQIITNSSEEDVPVLSIVADNLEAPWSIVRLPNNNFLLTEREGQVRLIEANGNSRIIEVISEAKESGEGGLLGITLHPQFEENNLVYFYYTYQDEAGNKKNRVVRAIYTNEDFSNYEIIIDNIPGALYHNGGRIKFGPDNYLYLTTGDAQQPEKAQDKEFIGGKILRVDDLGQAVSDNPFNSLVYSYGHRNPQGITWDANGNLWATEHGQSATDELNLIKKGANYGWPEIYGDNSKDGMESPVIHSGTNETWAPSGLAYYDNNIFFVGLRGNALYQVNISDINNVVLTKHFAGQFGRLRDLIITPEGIMYFISNNTDGRGEAAENDDKLFRLDLNRFIE